MSEDDEYEYEYIELAEGEELPEGAEYEYVEVPVEEYQEQKSEKKEEISLDDKASDTAVDENVFEHWESYVSDVESIDIDDSEMMNVDFLEPEITKEESFEKESEIADFGILDKNQKNLDDLLNKILDDSSEFNLDEVSVEDVVSEEVEDTENDEISLPQYLDSNEQEIEILNLDEEEAPETVNIADEEEVIEPEELNHDEAVAYDIEEVEVEDQNETEVPQAGAEYEEETINAFEELQKSMEKALEEPQESVKKDFEKPQKPIEKIHETKNSDNEKNISDLYTVSDLDNSLLGKAKRFDGRGGILFFQPQNDNAFMSISAKNKEELASWNIIIFDKKVISVSAEEKEINLSRSKNTARYARLIKEGDEKLDLFNEDKFKFMVPTEEFVKIKGHFIYGNVEDNSGLIVDDLITVNLKDAFRKQFSFNKPASGIVTGPNGTVIYFYEIKKILVVV